MSERVVGRCPMGCGETLFLGSGGYVTCSWVECPQPDAASDLLEGPHGTEWGKRAHPADHLPGWVAGDVTPQGSEEEALENGNDCLCGGRETVKRWVTAWAKVTS